MELALLLQVALSLLSIVLTVHFMIWVEVRWQAHQREEHHRELLFLLFRLAKMEAKSLRDASAATEALADVEREERLRLIARYESEQPIDTERAKHYTDS